MSFPFLMGELVPTRYRYLATGIIYAILYPGSGFGPMVAQSFINSYPSVGWRGVYWLVLAYEAIALLLWVTCVSVARVGGCCETFAYTLQYFPPTFEDKHGSDKKKDWLKHFDYVGMLLYTAGFVLFLFGLSEGGAVYPWSDPHVISFIVVGFVTLVAFVLWECYAPLREPFVPMKLFKDGM
jgi:MFS family permease